jgi:hypothetical protein
VLVAAAASGGAGVAASLLFRALGVQLLHPDAAARAVVARRVLDFAGAGIAPPGLSWPPLPAWLAALPAQADALYRGGWAGTFWSVAGLALLGGAVFALARRLARALGADDRAAALGAAGATLATWTPGMLYVAATPLVETLYLGLAAGACALVAGLQPAGGSRGSRSGERRSGRGALYGAAALVAAAGLVRYDAWPLVVWLAVVAGAARRSAADGARFALAAGTPLAAFYAYAVAQSGFPPQLRPDGAGLDPSPTAGSLLGSALHYMHAVAACTGPLLLVAGAAGVMWLAVAAARNARAGAALRVPAAAAAALWAPFALYVWRFAGGHPFRGRYALLAVPAVALGAAALAGRLGVAAARRWPLRPGRALLPAAAIAALAVLRLCAPLYGPDAWAHWPRSFLGSYYGWSSAAVARTADTYGLWPRTWFMHDLILFELARDLPDHEMARLCAAELMRRWDGRPILTSIAWSAPVMFHTGLGLAAAFRVEGDRGWERATGDPGDAGWVVGWAPDRFTERIERGSSGGPPGTIGGRAAHAELRLERWRVWRVDAPGVLR